MSDNKVSEKDESVPLIDAQTAKDRLFRRHNGRQMSAANVRIDPKKGKIRFSSTDIQLLTDEHKPNGQWQSYSYLEDNGDGHPNPERQLNGRSRSVHSDSDLSSVWHKDGEHHNNSCQTEKQTSSPPKMSASILRKSVSVENGANDGHNPSRFQVAKVSDEHNGENGIEGNGDTIRDIPPMGHHQSVDYSNSNSYDTRNMKSLRHYTREALPRVDNYRHILSVHRHMTRPTLDELHGVQTTIHRDFKNKSIHKNVPGVNVDNSVKFGWIQGVLVRCLLNIWGVMLFMRLSWVAGQAGIGLGACVILLATAVTTITSISMSAICTNGEVRGGGTYYMISRCLGPEFGGAIGIIFSIANAVAIAMYAVGFAEALRDLLESKGVALINGGLNDIRLISAVTVLLLLGIALIGTEWESKAQMLLLVILLIAMADFLVGSVIPPSDVQKAQGYVGWSAGLLADNFMPRFQGESFFSVFSVFFPAATGILAGANISGDLKDPQASIPRGTLLAILITTISYLLFLLICGATVLRDANNLPELLVGRDSSELYEIISNCSLARDGKCMHGSLNNYQIVELISAFGPLIYAGIFAATLSSALASLVSAPKVFQALCKDKLFPYIEYFGKGFGKSNEPRRGYILAFGIALACCIIGDLNSIAPIISNFFLAAYCLINFSCFHASFAKSPGFRPAFKYYNMWLSLLGSILCLIVMFITGWATALITFLIIIALYVWILNRKPDVNWGSSTQAQTYLRALHSVYRLNLVPDHVKNFRPQILVLSGSPSTRPPIVDFANSISKGIGLIVCGQVVVGSVSQRARNSLTQEANHWLQKRKIKGFYNLVEEESLSRGVKAMIQSIGMGKLRPNIVMLGMKTNWTTCESDELVDYFNTIHSIFDKHLALVLICLPNGLDYSRYGRISEILDDAEVKGLTASAPNLSSSFVSINMSNHDIQQNGNHLSVMNASNRDSISSRESTPSTPVSQRHAINDKAVSNDPSGVSVNDIPKEVYLSVNQFRCKQKKGFIDVWWLYDDGGLTLLLPYLLTTRKKWNGCKLRVFALANKKDELDTEQRNMAALLSKFRIDYSDVIVIPDIVKPPKESTKKEFKDLIENWRPKENDLSEDNDEEDTDRCVITDSELFALKDKSNRHMRLRELLCQYSKESSLIVMTLPMPRKGTCSAPLYMAWLHILTRDMPPFMLIRGDQTNVLTFYS